MTVAAFFALGACTLTSIVGPPRSLAAAGGRVERAVVAAEQARRHAPRIIEVDVFGDSITAGFGVPAHQTWVAVVSHQLRVTQPPSVQHRLYSYAIDGQSISTPSLLSADPSNPTLLRQLSNYVARPPRATPLAQRWVILTPSVNELIVSDAGTSAASRVAKAADGMRIAVGLLRGAGVRSDQILVLPMPPIGEAFAAEHDATSVADRPLAWMIASLNRSIADLLAVPRYGALDPNDDGLADPAFYDDLDDPLGRRGPDGLHLDADGHAFLGSAVTPALR
ncbi:MAG: SGNH/GDSL hydrolase family protein [Ilumatobacter sp.]|jgi:lysophospholipase L1-like esterase|uniref:SGNH/GDSL hydrolase family protein n=1 Tax=Ilumatobacter sp. TaxID=1967498 RepID=UPI00391DC2F6